MQEAGVDHGMLMCALTVFEELGLIRMKDKPFNYQMIPTGKVSLEDSLIRKRLMALKNKD